MEDARPILKPWLEDDHYALLGQQLANAYAACDSLMRSNIIFSNFAPGIEHRSDLLGLFVQHEISKVPELVPGFYSAVELNAARNCRHLRLYKSPGFVLTAHFLGLNEFRSGARKAENRAILASANGDLFASEALLADRDSTHVYCHLLHGGMLKPAHGTIAIPTRDQEAYVASTKLDIPEPQKAQVEEIRDEMAFKLREKEDHGKNRDEEAG